MIRSDAYWPKDMYQKKCRDEFCQELLQKFWDLFGLWTRISGMEVLEAHHLMQNLGHTLPIDISANQSILKLQITQSSLSLSLSLSLSWYIFFDKQHCPEFAKINSEEIRKKTDKSKIISKRMFKEDKHLNMLLYQCTRKCTMLNTKKKKKKKKKKWSLSSTSGKKTWRRRGWGGGGGVCCFACLQMTLHMIDCKSLHSH